MALLIAGATALEAQIVRINNPVDSVAFCSGFFVDQGVFNGPHFTDEADTITICSNSANPDQTHILLSFEQIDLRGTLVILNGPDAESDTIATFDNNTNSDIFFIQANADNPSGCLTAIFTPDGSGVAGDGWNAEISCVAVCQEVIANIGSSIPEVSPPDTGFIDVCLGDPISLSIETIYPQNGVIYDQADSTSDVRVTMGDGTVFEDFDITHVYQESGGYIIEVFVTDLNGCTSSNLISQRVRVAPVPQFQLQNETAVVCTDDPFTVSASSSFDPDGSSNIFVLTEEQAFGGTLILGDTTALPDGPDDPEYTTSLEFTNFLPGATLESIDDFESVCLDMEHSFVGDLDIFLSCPDGSEVQLVEFSNTNNLDGQFLGEPIDDDGQPLAQGEGFVYCFTPDAEFTWDEIVDELNIMGSESIPAGDYASVEPLSGLLGCPLNGPWTIRVVDNLGQDNGFIFSWSISINQDLLGEVEQFTVGFDDAFWSESPNTTADNGSSLDAVGLGAGPQGFVYNVVDEFGCVYDTTIFVDVLPLTDPNCYDCPDLLAEQSATFTGDSGSTITISLEEEDSSFDVPWQVTPSADFGNALFPSAVDSYESSVAVSTVSPANIVDATQDIVSVCVDINTEATGDVELFLEAPNGTRISLSSNNGGTGANFTGTCFTPTATTAIADGVAPFTGDFQPDGDWSTFNGSPLNGNWKIVAWDEGADMELGRFINWSITFRNQDAISYSWSPTDGLSCTDCPNPEVTLDFDGIRTYELTVSNDRGCSETGTISVVSGSDLVASITGTDPLCSDTFDGTLTVTVTGGTEPYSISWDPPAEGFELFDLGPGVYSATVTDANGDSAVVAQQLIGPEPIVVQANIVDVDCAGDSTGAIMIQVTGGTGVYTFLWDGESDDDGNLENIPAGTYTLLVQDENGCTREETYTVTQSEPLSIMAEVVDVACNGESTGSIDLMVSGGTGDYTFLWSNDATTEDLNDIPAGAYTVTVTDSLGCVLSNVGAIQEEEIGETDAMTTTFDRHNFTDRVALLPVAAPTVEVRSIVQVDTIIVNEPPALSFDATVTQVQCIGDATGSIELDIAGGTPPYEVIWNIDATGPFLGDLPEGTYSATITDNNGCTLETGDITIDGITQVEVQITSTDPLCTGDANGIIETIASGGTEPYSYEWSDEGPDQATRDDLAAGTYSVSVTDVNGCSASVAGIELVDPPLLTCEVFVIQQPFTGNDGSIFVVATGGTGDYSYAWSNGGPDNDTLTNLMPDTYSATVTDENGCTTTCSVELQAFVTIGDFVFSDLNSNGIQDPDEPGFANRTVNLINQDNADFSQTTQTDADGRYEFTAIAGNYILTFERPNGFAASPKDASSDDIDSDINPDGSTDVITLVPDEVNLDIDAGFFDPCFPPISFPGTIGFDSEVCGAGNIPDLIVELEPAVNGGDGELNYLWMKRAQNSTQWMPIPNTNTINYQPGPVFESTFFTRCVRRDECTYVESNAILVTVRDDAVANINGPSVICENEVVTFSAAGAGPGAQYSWNFGFAATVPTSNAQSVDVSFISFGSFTVTLSVTENGCTATATQQITITNNPNICSEDRPGLSSFGFTASELTTEVFPNPTEGRVWLDVSGTGNYSGQDLDIQLFDARGRLVAEHHMLATDGRIALEELTAASPGMYMLRLLVGDELRNHRIVVR
ncbi:MAG: SdrD B-like domain-containing protein [Bacteroidota bacterium]